MSFENIVLNRRIAGYLINAVKNNRLHHSLLFEGPEGVGKSEMAMALAKALNCTGPQPFESCVCSNCQKIERNAALDVKRLEPEGQFIRVDPVRRAIREMSFPPYEGRKRVYIFSKAETMNAEAANTLLKSLEEPPAHVQFILLTAHPHMLLPTIRSRCQRVRFLPLHSEEISGLLGDEESEDRRRLRNALSGGSILKAREMNLEDYGEKREAALKILSALTAQGFDESHLLAPERAIDLKQDMAEILQILFLLLRDVLVLATGCGSEQLINQDLQKDLEPYTEKLGPAQIIRSMEEVNTKLRDLKFNVNRRMAYDALLIALSEIQM